ncbi:MULTISPECIES: alpha/beta hydrolase [Nocardia]|uniref:alpha/beta hydrolase n=1 Tax=Nocardia TaxID=1817 RepID=UPI000D6967EB|nr:MULTISPECIES: alpha/beta hydrolase family protein [Nocardia]
MLSRREARHWISSVILTAALLAGAAGVGAPRVVAEPDLPGTGSQGADPIAVPPTRPVIERIEPINDRRLRVFVQSPAMGRTVQVQVLLPEDRSRPRPTVYMLDGRSASSNTNNWLEEAHVDRFYADKDVNVVLTIGGPASYYTDWQRPDPVLGTNRWETFLAAELPPLIDAEFLGNGHNAVMGVSMGAEAAMMLMVRLPGLYSAVAAHSGCYSIGSELGQAQARAIVATYLGQPDNMFGRYDDPDWLAHDVTAHAETLRGKAIYVSVGSGVPGAYDVPGNPDVVGAITFGAPLEAGANICTHRLADRLAELGIPATVNFRATGTHSWPYWTDELALSWPTIADAIGAA